MPLNATNSYIRQTTVGSGAYLQIGFADVTGSGCINGVQALVAFHASGTQTNHGATRIRDQATETVVHNTSMGSNSLLYASAAVTPAGGRWTTSSLNGVIARIGYSTDVNPVPYWDALLLEYDLTT